MGLYIPTSTIFPNGVVTIVSNSATPYEEIQESMGSYAYQIKNIYIKTDNVNQILQPLILRRYDSNGDIIIEPIVPAVDPYQQQTSLNIGISSDDYILDGKLTIGYNILADEDVFIYIDTIELDRSNLLKIKEDSVFLDLYNIYTDYSEKVKTREINILNKDDSRGISEGNIEEECCC